MGTDLGLRRPLRMVVLSGVSAVLGCLVLVGCSGSDKPSATPPDDPAQESASAGHGQAEVAEPGLFVSTGARTGGLTESRADSVTEQVGEVVGDWIEAAYLKGPWPRTDFKKAWPRFSSGLKAKARAEQSVTSNASIGSRIDGVRVEKRRVAVDVLAVRTYPAGATARVDLVFVTSGEVRQRVHVKGELHLTPIGSRWQVFGYDLSRTAKTLPPPVKAPQDKTSPDEGSAR
ncbi:hypothetical protein BJ980_003488 [Nocardioides daedukensis]|uniref:Uncharacterized protein n=1 Tax=Nocardioides daedukensis TaxID=634462 RepID=A0A7Y9S293_9ACTN|nr:hypothetical protein [Nocardioides daedukensis]NYG60565.1 hypothetical protein [Nocardioides daedukensis]